MYIHIYIYIYIYIHTYICIYIYIYIYINIARLKLSRESPMGLDIPYGAGDQDGGCRVNTF